MGEDRTVSASRNPAGRKADAFRKVLELTERIEACLRKGETDEAAGLLNERQLWMDRIDSLARFLPARTEEDVRKPFKVEPSQAAIDNAERGRIAQLIRACIDKNAQCEDLLQSACGKARSALSATRPVKPAFVNYPDARNSVPRFVDVRS